eukprot:NODE_269_length_1763_cov_64.907090_g241_i0.p1 GENE.NODE_269_length_1763_cov_64.907090_g241_i0~~NODE_269_length_1763_cov_64.907090_g241_i0.p1  ORF type:complete len:415 (-),score=48.84 NODE_269_length_1763_cov_64.907090_g241_i0:79-1323(-)
MKVAIEGCCHGTLEETYQLLEYIENQHNIKVDLVLNCGDFQATRNLYDLSCLACPPKYRKLTTFHQYYSGEKVAPIPTIFIGGNHEASNYMWELFHGGWVCPNIYYMGLSGVVQFGGLRIGGLSGIFNPSHYRSAHFERPPFNESTLRSIYHTREHQIFKMSQYNKPLDIVMSHDWPEGIAQHGNIDELLRRKPYFRQEIQSSSLGSPPLRYLLYRLEPRYWFSAHLHVKFPAIVNHGQGSTTKFLALDKVLPRRDFLQILDFPDGLGEKEICYDPDWLALVRSTHPFLDLGSGAGAPPLLPDLSSPKQQFPDTIGDTRACFSPTKEELDWVHETLKPLKKGSQAYPIPKNFERDPTLVHPVPDLSTLAPFKENNQTVQFCDLLEIPTPYQARTIVPVSNPSEISLSSSDDEAN